MTPADKVRAGEIMYGTGSRQHRAALARWGDPMDYAQCGECNEPDRIMSLVNGLCVACNAKLRSE